MRSASTDDRTDETVIKSVSPNYRSALKLERYDSIGGNWETIDDLDTDKGVTWTESGKKEKYANFALTPQPSTISFSIININGTYSDGSGTRFEGTIEQETKVRLQAGPILNTLGGAQTVSMTLNDITGVVIGSYFWHTKFNTSYVDITSVSSTPTHFTDLTIPLYDSETYDDSTYSIDAYTVHTYDTGGQEYQDISQFVVNCNNTKGAIYYRSFNVQSESSSSVSTDWTSGGATVNGNKTITYATDDRFLQVAILYDGIAWSEDLRLNSIIITYQSQVEWIYKGVFYLDRPKYTDPRAPEMPMINCTGRDAYKKAINYDINIPDLTAGVTMNQLFKDICDQIGILYSATSIDAMSGGEKSLTALAFLFAIQSFEPAPFYIFDEVDAALDKENSLKISRMLKEISRDGQFISITHNDSIVKEADQIIGVALNKQKSSVIGLRLKQEVKAN